MIKPAVKFKFCTVTVILIGWMLQISSAIAIVQDADEAAEIHYTVDLADAKNHYVTVTLDAATTGVATELMMPVWTPGSYLVREFARHIQFNDRQRA